MDKDIIVNQDNLGLNYVTIPLEAFQTLGDPVTVAHNVIIDADGQIQILNTQNVDALDPQATFFIDVPPQLVLNDGTDTSTINPPVTTPETINKNSSNEIRYLRCKIDQKPIKKPVIKQKEKKSSSSIKCLLCDTTFLKVSKYRLHMQEHRNDKTYKCGQCKESFNIEDNYKVHVALHAKGDSVCPICHRKFARWASLKSHLNVHLIDETFTCTECLSEFDKEEELNQHLENQHTMPETKVPSEDPVQLLTCVYCKYLFQDTNALKEHVKLHVKSKKLVYKRKIKRRSNIKEYPHKCEFCQKTFSKVCLLERHRRIHTGDKPFVCPKCKKGFSQKGTLQLHINKHEGKKPYHCLFCSAKFTQKGNLRVHLEKTHSAGKPGEKLYRCTHCTCIFKKVASLNAHVTKYHAGSIKENHVDIAVLINQLKDLNEQANPKSAISKLETLHKTETKDFQHFVKLAESAENGTIRRYIIKQRKVDDINWYMCSYCVREFKKPSDLIRHIRIHTKEKPFVCELCGQAFSVKSSLINHMNVHTEKEYFCVYCDSPYSSLKTLNVHLRLHDKNAIATRSRPFKCSVCNVTFTSAEKANEHLSLHNVDSPVKAPKPLNLGIKMKQPLVETAQGVVSIAPPKLKTIANKNVEDLKQRKYKCHLCAGMFIKPAHLKRHMLIHITKKDFACLRCERSFSTQKMLDEHSKFHNRIRNVHCKICEKAFYTNVAMIKHMSVHNPSSPFICPYCQKRFKSAHFCRNHINTTHKEEAKKALENEIESNDLHVSPSKTIDSSKVIESKNTFHDALNVVHSNVQSVIKIMPLKKNIQESNCEQQNNTIITDITQTSLNEQVSENDISIQNLGADGISFPTIYTITAEELQSFESTNVVNALLPQLKLENAETLLQCSINELQEPTSFPLTSLIQDQGTQSYEDDQSFDTFNPNLIFHANINELTQNMNEKEVETENSDKNKPNQVTFSNAQIDIELNRLAGQKADTIIHDNLAISNNDALKSNELNYFINYANDDYIDINSLNIAGSSIGKFIEGQGFNALEHHSPAKDQEQQVITEDKTPNVEVEVATSKDTDLPVKNLTKNDVMQKADTILEIIETGVEYVNIYTELTKARQGKQKKYTSQEIKNNPFACPYCRERFKHKAAMFRHISVKHKETICMNCMYCNKAFKKKTDLDRHHRTHTGEKPFRCEKCEKSFSLKSTLSSHYKTHDPLGNIKEFKCMVCDGYLSTKSSLMQHMKNHAQIKPYTCDLCPLKFRTAAHKKNHMKTHINSKSRISTVNLLESILMQTNDELRNEANAQSTREAVVEYSAENEAPNVETSDLIQTELTEENLELVNSIDPILLQINSASYNPDIGIQIEINGQIINVKPDVSRNLFDTDGIIQESEEIQLNNNQLGNLESVIQANHTENNSTNTIEYDPDYINIDTDNTIEHDDDYIEDNDYMENTDYMDISHDNNYMDLEQQTIQIDNDNALPTDALEDDTSIRDDNVIHIKDVGDIIHESNKIVAAPITVKPKKPPSKLQCGQCLKFYVTKSVLTKHIRKVHRMVLCPKCSKGFDTYESMEKHHKLHFGYRPFSCSLCPNSFMDEPSLKTHLRRIHNHS